MRHFALGATPMADPDSHPQAGAAAPAGDAIEKATLTGTLVHLWPYIWPSDRRDLKLRVLLATGLLFLAKLGRASCRERV